MVVPMLQVCDLLEYHFALTDAVVYLKAMLAQPVSRIDVLILNLEVC
jgi:hypothetical protein